MPRPARLAQILPFSAPITGGDIRDLAGVADAQVNIPSGRDTLALSSLFGVLADPTRLRIIAALDHGRALCVGDVAAAVGLSNSATSHQLRILRDHRLVRVRREGRQAFYSLDDEHVRGLYQQGLEHIRHVEASS